MGAPGGGGGGGGGGGTPQEPQVFRSYATLAHAHHLYCVGCIIQCTVWAGRIKSNGHIFLCAGIQNPIIWGYRCVQIL